MNEPLSPLKAIRKNCLICGGGSSEEVRLCPITDCPVYPYRFGKRPATAEAHFAKLKAKKECTEQHKKIGTASTVVPREKNGRFQRRDDLSTQ
jgi:hypothetical protein